MSLSIYGPVCNQGKADKTDIFSTNFSGMPNSYDISTGLPILGMQKEWEKSFLNES